MAERSLAGRMWDYLKDTVNERLDIGAFAKETLDTVVQKTAQGAAELSHALFHQSNAEVPYGSAQNPVKVEGPQKSYQDMLHDASRGAGQDQERGMDR